jgi:hypothetical protein
MAKKKRKQTRSSGKTISAQMNPVEMQAIEAQAIKTPRRAINDMEFNPDYAPIVRDLKRIGILAVSFFVVLIALSFIL